MAAADEAEMRTVAAADVLTVRRERSDVLRAAWPVVAISAAMGVAAAFDASLGSLWARVAVVPGFVLLGILLGAVPRCLCWMAAARYYEVHVAADYVLFVRRRSTSRLAWADLSSVLFHRGHRRPELAKNPDLPAVTVVDREGRKTRFRVLVIAPERQDRLAAALAARCAEYGVEYEEEAQDSWF